MYLKSIITSRTMPHSDLRLLVAMPISARLLRPKRKLWWKKGLAFPKGKERLSTRMRRKRRRRRRRLNFEGERNNGEEQGDD